MAKSGISGRVSADDQAGDPVRQPDPDQHRERHDAGQHELRQVAREVGVQPVQAPGGQRGDLAGSVPGEPGRAQPQHVVGEPPAQLGLYRGRGAQRGGLPAVAGRGAGQQDGEEHAERAGQHGDAGSGRRAGQEPGQQAGLDEDQAGGGQAEADGDREVAAGRGRVAEQPRVERLHGRPPTGSADSGPVTGGAVCPVGTMSERVSRLRNTQ